MGAHAIPVRYKNNPDAFVDIIIEDMLPKVAEKKPGKSSVTYFVKEGVFSIDQSRRILDKLQRSMEWG